jgi:hypothetical protein
VGQQESLQVGDGIRTQRRRTSGGLLHEQHVGVLRQRERGYAGGDTAAQALADAQEHLAVARSQAERCARLRLATAVLRRGVESYRQKNQGPILQRVSRLFERLTRGRYEQIQVQYEGDRAGLRCFRQGELVEVEDALSSGPNLSQHRPTRTISLPPSMCRVSRSCRSAVI